MKFSTIIRFLLPLIILTGCATKVEVNEQTFVFAMYINKGKQPGNVEVTISAPLPNRLMSGQQAGSGSGGDPYAMVSKDSATIQDALHLIQKDLSRRLDFSHTRVLVLGRSYAEDGIEDLMDWFEREPTIDFRCYLMVAPGDAKQIARLTPVFEQMPSEVLIKFAEHHNMVATTARDILYASKANQGYALTYLSAGKKPLVADPAKKDDWAGVQGTAIFQGHKLRATLPLKESMAVSWALKELRDALYTVSWDDGKNKGKASLLLINIRSQKKVKMTPDGPVFTVMLKGRADIIYKKDTHLPDSAATNKMIERELNDQVSTQMNRALRTSQRAGADILQLGMVLDWHYPDAWHKLRSRWEDFYRNEAEIQVSTHITIRNLGASFNAKSE
ncbi:Ger(x)C family spore germination protein [Paenibacillus lautus]|uniref:Ger(x)C family spore germination protein n=1 Tax=Paenibacillus lautus TaxID=1401 RepID=UPI001C7D59E0|nr:Ger(x)C family spore germination protein [Paenibacillus lautus]MBX4146610.1 Ger(x)C family spore germination protein [Paenibacillus lautus]